MQLIRLGHMMRFRFWKKCNDESYSQADQQHDIALSEDARRNSQRILDEVRRQGAAVTEVSRSLRQLRERNHFGELLELSMRKS